MSGIYQRLRLGNVARVDENEDRSDRPVAVIMRGQAAARPSDGRTLATLDAELKALRTTLLSSGYDVVEITNGSFIEIVEKLGVLSIRERLVVFHFAGHALPDGMLLQAADGQEVVLTPERLAQLLLPCINLRMLFVNGCYAANQLNAFDNALENLGHSGSTDFAFIGGTGPVFDEVAAQFAISIYENLEAGKPLDVAATDARNEIKALTSETDVDQAELSVRTHLRGQSEFILKDGTALIYDTILKQSRRTRLKPLLVYTLIAAIVGWMGAVAAYDWALSPAFLTAYGLQTSEGAYLEEHFFSEIGPLKSCTEWDQSFTSEISEGVEGSLSEPPRFFHGQLIDGLRSVLWAVMLTIAIFLASLAKFPKNFPLVSRTVLSQPLAEVRPFVRSWFGLIAVAVGLFGNWILLDYHLFEGPSNLASFYPDVQDYRGNDREKRWTLLHCWDKVWMHAHPDILAHFPTNWDRFNQGITGKASEVWYLLYERPYLYLLANSYVNVVGLLLPVFYISIVVAWVNWYWVRLGLRRTSVLLRSPKENERRIAVSLEAVQSQSRRFMHRYCILLSTIGIVGWLEIAYLLEPVAGEAKRQMASAIVTLVIGLASIIVLIFGFLRHRSDFAERIDSACYNDEELDKSGKIRNLLKEMRPITWIDALMLVLVAAVIVWTFHVLLNPR